MIRPQLLAYLALGVVALFLVGTVLTRVRDGQCYGRYRGWTDCAKPAPHMPRRP